MINVMITNAWHDDNKGDCGIVLAIIEMLSRVVPIKVTLVSEFAEEDKRFKGAYRYILSEFPEIEVIASPWPIFPVLRSRTSFLIYKVAKKFMHGYISKKNFKKYVSKNLSVLPKLIADPSTETTGSQVVDRYLKKVRNADIVVAKGGSYIFSNATPQGDERLARVLFPLYLAVSQKKKVVLFAQSICDLESETSKAISSPILNNAHVLLRENKSKQYLERTFGLECSVVQDAAFCLSEKPDLRLPILDWMESEKNKGIRLIGFTVRPWTYGNENKVINKLIAIMEFITTRDTSAKIMLIPQVTGPGEFEDDRVMIRKVFEAAGKNLKDKVIVVDDDYSPFILKEIYRRLWFLVGTRLHSVIFSLSSGVPAIALSYSPHKSEGVMDMVGLSDFVFPVDDLPLDACFKAVEQIYNDRDVFANNVLLKVKERSIDSLVIAAELLNDEAIKDINHGLTYCDIEWISALKPS